MPLYEYQCAKCGKKSEFIQSFSDPHETKCPKCGWSYEPVDSGKLL